MNNQVTETNNKAFVVGKLKEKKIEFKPNSTGKLMASGHLTVVVDTPTGKGEIKVKVMQNAETKAGGTNTLFKGLQTVANTYKSIQEVGEENADTIKIEGKLEDGTYYNSATDSIKEKVDIRASFINRVDASEQHCCKVMFEGVITQIMPSTNGSLEVEIVGIGYEGIAVPIKAEVPSELVAPFQARYTVGSTTTLNIAIIDEVELKEMQSEVGFGTGFGEKIEKHNIKRTVFGGGNVIYAGTVGAISEDDIKKGLALRQAKFDASKEKSQSKNNGATMTSGFGTAGAPAGGFPTGGFPTGNAGAGTFGGFPTGGFPTGM